MTDRLENLIGAFANNIADVVDEATQREVGISGPSAAALALINHDPGLTIETLHYGLGLTHAGTVRLINRLETAKLVMRKTSPADKRAVALHLTPKGKAACIALLAKRQSVLNEKLSVLSADEQETLEKLVSKLLRCTTENVAHAYSVCRLCDASVCTSCPVEAGLETSPATEIHI
jgi:DNA-binding MarR family transcriptional regulator